MTSEPKPSNRPLKGKYNGLLVYTIAVKFRNLKLKIRKSSKLLAVMWFCFKTSLKHAHEHSQDLTPAIQTSLKASIWIDSEQN